MIAQSIIKTLAFFDLFGIPLTAAEVYSHAYGAPTSMTLAQTQNALRELTVLGRLKRHESFYALPDRDATMISDYKLRQAQTFTMIRDAQPWLARLAAWPNVRALAICNSLSFLNANPQSDIDVFILVEPKKLWSTRFALVSLLQLFGKRPTNKNQAGKICLSFFLNAEAADISGMALPLDDVYLLYWSKFLLPTYDKAKAFAEFSRANKKILRPVTRATPNMTSFAPRTPVSRIWSVIFAFVAPLVSFLETPLKKWQQNRFPVAIKNMVGKGTSVVINDNVLKFHTQDRREEYREAWLKRCAQFLS